MTKRVTTLNKIRAHHPCESGWRKLLASLGKTDADDDPLELRHILESNGVDDFLWSLRVLPPSMDNRIRLLLCDLVEPAMRFVPRGEDRPQIAIDTARRYARGEATKAEMYTAGDAARAAAWDAAWDAAGDAAWAAARVAAWDAAGDAAWAAARVASRVAAWSAMIPTIKSWLDEEDER